MRFFERATHRTSREHARETSVRLSLEKTPSLTQLAHLVRRKSAPEEREHALRRPRTRQEQCSRVLSVSNAWEKHPPANSGRLFWSSKKVGERGWLVLGEKWCRVYTFGLATCSSTLRLVLTPPFQVVKSKTRPQKQLHRETARSRRQASVVKVFPEHVSTF